MQKDTAQEDHKLLISLRKGEKRAFNILFRKYYPVLCAYCSRFVELKDAEEIVQDIMVWLWEKREIHEISTSLSSYLFKSVYRGALARISRHKLRQQANTYFYEEMQNMLEDTDFYLLEELSNHIHAAIMSLPETYREAFIMHRFQQMTYKEIAEVVNVSTKTVDYRIQQALKRLRIILKEYLPVIMVLFVK